MRMKVRVSEYDGGGVGMMTFGFLFWGEESGKK